MDIKDQVGEVLKIVTQKYNMNKWRYEKKGLCKDIQNFMGYLTPVCLTDEDNGQALNVFIKSAPFKPYLDVIMQPCYNREVYFYTTFLPNLQKKTNMSLHGLVPKCYYADSTDSKVVVLEDMTIHGFVRYDKGIFLDQEHMTVTLQAVAKFHALSMIIKDQDISLPNIEVLTTMSPEDDAFRFSIILFMIDKYLHFFEGTPCEKALKRLHRYMNSSRDFYDGYKTKAKCLVYGHGDLWIENILFKYYDKKPFEVCLLDYQCMGLFSPATDILRLIMSSSESSIRRQHFKDFVSTYYVTLKEILRSNGLELEELYSEDDLNNDLQMTFPFCYGIIFMSFLLWLHVEDSQSIMSLDNSLPDPESKNFIMFKNIMIDLLMDFQELGFCEKY